MKEFISYSDEELMPEIKEDNMFAFDVLFINIPMLLTQFNE